MTVYDLHRSSAIPLSTVVASRISTFLFNVADRFPKRSRCPKTLLRMSDWQLADLGLTRADLERLQ
ncbi:DUF1127 domain-containing protein [Palleronia abyssalis]|uniref:YjiS-like domain-containing protein n=1 Tax=Palleronia abyssalis TaxID=1501240 RepID=A0A2R8BX54_9RHOB|nr:DUF1127 domain-containing protein [Palleronia abyssalis]SPJ24735.1 hypothetical protein PAA8504_02573 [Palleronia abyssalis]